MLMRRRQRFETAVLEYRRGGTPWWITFDPNTRRYYATEAIRLAYLEAHPEGPEGEATRVEQNQQNNQQSKKALTLTKGKQTDPKRRITGPVIMVDGISMSKVEAKKAIL